MGEILNRREQIMANKLPPEIPDTDDLVSKTDYATASKAGVVKIGNNVNVSSGKISVPAASDETAGVVKIGNNLSIDENGFLNAAGGGGVELTEIWDGTGTIEYRFPTGKTMTDYNFLVVVGGDGDVVRMTEIVPTAIIPESGSIMLHMLYYDTSPAVLKMTVGRTTISRYAGSSSGLVAKKLYVF